MAELDIKDIWAKGKLQRTEDLNLDLDNVIGKKSKNVLYWVKFILWIEFGFNVLGIPFMIMTYLRGDYDMFPRYVFPLSFFLILIYLVYYQFLIKKINDFDYTGNVHASLSKIYKYLNYYLLHYKVIIWGLMPVIFGLSFTFVLDDLAAQGINFELWSNKFWKFLGVMSVIYLVIMLIMHFLVRLIYGRKIKRLKGMIKELEE